MFAVHMSAVRQNGMTDQSQRMGVSDWITHTMHTLESQAQCTRIDVVCALQVDSHTALIIRGSYRGIFRSGSLL